MAQKFVTEIDAVVKLDTVERSILEMVGVQSWEDLDSLIQSFPSLAGLGVRVPLLSNAAFQNSEATYVSRTADLEALNQAVAFGALPPPDVPMTLEAVVGLPSPMAAAVLPPAAPAAIDLRRSPWPVRNQNPRGTCVAFGATACAEHFISHGGAIPNLSEQFLYWAIKTNTADPQKAIDGTWLQFARDALASDGICGESDWRYVNALVNPVSGATAAAPTAQARTNASANRLTAGTYVRSPGGAAALALRLMQNNRRPLGISLPVFADPSNRSGPTNWTTAVGWSYGRVLNPPPTSIVVGGHCVCLTGFIPSPDEPAGGHFIIRNSWDVAWGSANPSPGSGLAPEPGYGDVSATYVDTYCWELFQL
jgi:hypothetical protein